MTPEERADRAVHQVLYVGQPGTHQLREDLKRNIAKEIREAVREERKEWQQRVGLSNLCGGCGVWFRPSELSAWRQEGALYCSQECAVKTKIKADHEKIARAPDGQMTVIPWRPGVVVEYVDGAIIDLKHLQQPQPDAVVDKSRVKATDLGVPESR